jgi:CheY-like chemotaxis protein
MEQHRKKILLVDDDHAVVAMFRAMLGKRYDLVVTLDPHEAVDLARSHLPDLILCDLDMPGLAGDEVAAKLSHDGMTARIPLVYLASHELAASQETTARRRCLDKNLGAAKLATSIDAILAPPPPKPPF